MKQAVMFCSCGAPSIRARGFCSRCYWAWRRDRKNFAGLRSATIERDHQRCTCCGSESLVVHHRRYLVRSTRQLITLCTSCHPKIHKTIRPRFGMNPHLYALWRELNPQQAEQIALFDDSVPSVQGVPAVHEEQQALFAVAS